MNSSEFGEQIARIKSCFGEKHYPQDRVNIMWAAVKNMSPEWLKGMVDQFIGSSRQPPLVPDFVEAAAAERDRIWQEQKKRESSFGYNQWISLFSQDEERMFAQTIVKRLQGDVSDQDWACFQRMLDDLAVKERVENKKRTMGVRP